MKANQERRKVNATLLAKISDSKNKRKKMHGLASSSNAVDEPIEEANVSTLYGAPPIGRRNSIEDLKANFEILHEEEVDENLLKDIMKIVQNNEERVKEEKDMAKLLKEEVDEKHGKHWQAIVAYTNLGCNVEHEVKTFVYLRRNNHIYILFRTPIGE